jgi:hypothetical protein
MINHMYNMEITLDDYLDQDEYYSTKISFIVRICVTQDRAQIIDK